MILALDHVDSIFSLTGQVRFDSTRFTGGEEGAVSKTIGNVWASGAIFIATTGAGRELWVGISRVRRKLSGNQ